MKIAILSHLKFPISEPFAGGLERHTHLLATMLRARGYAVTLFATKGSDPALHPVEVCEPTGDPADDADEKRIERLEFAAYGAILENISDGGFDLVHNNSLHHLPLRLAKSLMTPMLTVLHTPPFEALADGMRAAGPDAAVAAVSQSLAEQWRGIAPVLSIIGNGIDLKAFPFQAVADEPQRVIWSGRIVPEKGLHLAIDAARAADRPIAFAGPRWDTPYWRDEIASRLGQDVTDLGHLGQRDLACHLGRSQVALVTPCWEEPFGLVVAEALACGTPIAGFVRGALPDIIDPTCGRLAAAGDVSALARAILEAAALDRAACRWRAKSLCDAHAMIAGYEKLYRELVGRTVSPVVPAPSAPFAEVMDA